MKLNQKLLEQLRNDEITVENNGTIEQLIEVLKAAFPKHGVIPAGNTIYYSRSANTDRWEASPFKDKDLPTFKISDFYQPEQRPSKGKPIKYLVDGTEYSLDYQNLKFRYEDICQYSDQQFLDELPQIAHLACIIATLKGLGTQATIGDKGIIHELIHLMTEPNEPANDLQEIREKFNNLIQLV